jgi:hypothetical protein
MIEGTLILENLHMDLMDLTWSNHQKWWFSWVGSMTQLTENELA